MSNCSNSARTCGEVIKSGKRRQSRARGGLVRIDRAQGLFRSRADRDVLGQINPPNRAVRVDVKLGRPGNVVAFGTGAAMQNIVTPNDLRVLIGQKRKRVSHFPTMSVRHIDRIDTDRREMNSSFLEIRKPFLKTPQLGVTKWSP